MLLDRAVINAGPLVALSLAGRLDVLPALFGEFWRCARDFAEDKTGRLFPVGCGH